MPDRAEVEFKLRARGELVVAAVDAALRELGANCRLADSRRHTDVYLDDARGSLRAAGLGLRLRDDRQGARLTCKRRGTTKDGLFTRVEIELPWPNGAAPTVASELPLALRDAVEPFVLDRPLRPWLSLVTQRELRVLQRDGEDLCEVAIDAVEASAAERSTHFHELEVEVVADLPSNERLVAGLREFLPLDPATDDKPAHAATLLGIEDPAPEADAGDAQAAERPLAVSVLRAAQRHLATLRDAEAPVRGDVGANHLHRMRVALRRLRSLVRAFRDLWPADAAERLKSHLRDTGRRLGALRDLDVALEILPPSTPALPPALQAPAQRLLGWVRTRRDAMHAEVLEWLRSPARLAAAANVDGDLAAILTTDGDGALPTGVAVPARLAKAAAQLKKRALGIAEELPIEPAHELRIAAKRVRYLAEEFAELPKLDVGKAIRVVTRVQQRFGSLCDHEVAVERLLGWLHIATGDGEHGASTAAALGALAMQHEAEAQRARRRARKALGRLDRKAVWQQLGC